ncbi:MAG: hypothetical protein KC496_09380 [Anaerolineae bacterium]|nr:hypothetical protein [Anaerolineae bacterium]
MKLAIFLAHGALPGYWDEGLFFLAVVLHAAYLAYIWWDNRRAARIEENTSEDTP